MAGQIQDSTVAPVGLQDRERARKRSIAERIVGGMLLPGYDRFVKGRQTFRYLQTLEKTQWLHPEEIGTLQVASLKKLLDHAAGNVPYWQEWFEQKGFAVSDFGTLEDLVNLPTTDKDLIRRNAPSMVAKNYLGKTWTKSTGGSTGVPFTFEHTPDSHDWRVAVSKRGYGWAGCGDGVKQAHIWGSALGQRNRLVEWKETLHHFVERKAYFNCFDMSDEKMNAWLSKLQRYQPSVIVGYTNPLFLFAKFILDKGALCFRPRSVITGAEPLYDFQRTIIRDAFQCDVFNTYGSREFMLIASECEDHGRLHVSAENLIVEILDRAGQPVEPGEMGEVVVTDLHNYGMPFIRYRLGDLAVASAETCKCGRGLPLLDRVVGRSLDMILTADGRAVPGEFFPHLMKDVQGVARFQVVQESLANVVVTLVVNNEFGEAARGFMENEITQTLGSTVDVNYQFVDDIPLTVSGKHRVTISNLRAEH